MLYKCRVVVVVDDDDVILAARVWGLGTGFQFLEQK